jgi:hypothetical protein
MYFAGLFLFCFTLPCSQHAERCSLMSVDGRRLRHTKQYSRHMSRRQIDIRRLYHRERWHRTAERMLLAGCGACSRETTTALQLLPAAYPQSYQDNTGIYLKITHKPHSLGTWWRSRLRHCAMRRKAADSIPDGVTGIFYCRNPSGRTMALRSTQPLTGMNTRNTSLGVKAAG